MNRYIIYIGVALLLLCGCDPASKYLDKLSGTDAVSLTIKGITALEYRAETHQLGFSPDLCQFRVSDDDMADYFFITCSAMPSQVGQKLSADIEYTTPDDVKTRKGVEFEVVDVRGDKIWLWNQRGRIGAVVQVLE